MDARSRPQGRQELQNLIDATQQEQSQAALEKVNTLIQELQGAFAALSNTGGQAPQAIPPLGAAPAAPVSHGYTPPQPERKVWQGPPGKFSLPAQPQTTTLPEVYEHPSMRVLWRPRESSAHAGIGKRAPYIPLITQYLFVKFSMICFKPITSS